MKVAIIGIGLIGGSFAKRIKALYEEVTIYAMDVDEQHIFDALSLNMIDGTLEYSGLKDMDIVIVSVPVDTSLEILPKVLNAVADDTLVFDVGSTKELICNSLKVHPRRRNFLATHPVAGNEYSGPKAAIQELFEGKTSIICEIEMTAFKIQEKALELFEDMGMRIRYMDAKAHDRHMAYVSHLSHISSFMLGKTVMGDERNERDIFDMAESGFESSARLAKSSPSMWTPIFDHNNENIIAALDKYIVNLNHFKQLLMDENYKMLYKSIENANRIKEVLERSHVLLNEL